jgi:hypothetical protein
MRMRPSTTQCHATQYFVQVNLSCIVTGLGAILAFIGS